MKRRLLLAAAGMLTACTSVSGVTSRQDGHFTVTSRARWDIVSWNHVRSAGMKRAQTWCDRQRKGLHTVETHSQGLLGVRAQSVEIVFDCV